MLGKRIIFQDVEYANVYNSNMDCDRCAFKDDKDGLGDCDIAQSIIDKYGIDCSDPDSVFIKVIK